MTRYSPSVWRACAVAATVVVALLLGMSELAVAEGLDARSDRVVDVERRITQSLVQDADGYLWFGSTAGLLRFDGYDVTTFRADPARLSSDRVDAIAVDSVDPNVLWLATDNGLNRLERESETFTVFQHDPDDPDSLGDNVIAHVVEDRRDPNYLWVATISSGLNRFDKTTGEVVRYEHDPRDSNSISYPEAWRILPDPADEEVIWVGTWGGGLDRFNTATETWTHFPHDPDDPSSLPWADNIVISLTADADDPHTLWMGSFADGMASFDTRTERFTHYPSSDAPGGLRRGAVAAIFDDGDGRLWIGSWIEDTGVTRFDKATGRSRTVVVDPSLDDQLSSNAISQFFRDRTGILWITHAAGAIDKIDPNLQQFRTLDQSDGLAGEVTQALLEDRGGNVWIGTTSGLSRFTPSNGSIVNYNASGGDDTALSQDNVISLYEDPDGLIWVSTFATGTIDVLDPKRGRVVDRYVTEADSFRVMAADPADSNIMWLGVRNGGLGKLDRTTGAFTFFEPDPEDPNAITNLYVEALLHDRESDVIWTGGPSGGLNRFDKQTETFVHYRADPNDPFSIASDSINDIFQDESGLLWIAAGGLARFDPSTERFERIEQLQAQSAGDVVAIERGSDDMLWLATGNGLIRFDPDGREVLNHFTTDSGVQRGAFSAGASLRARNGALHFGGVSGITSVNPARLRSNPHPPLLEITGLSRGGEPLALADSDGEQRLELSWRAGSFDFEFLGLSYSQPERTTYSFRLDGFDDEWSTPSTRRFSRYTNLQPGEYTLRVRAANADGVWTEQDATLPVVVTAPFWASWTFRVLVAVVFVGVLLAVLWIRSWLIARRNRELESLVAERSAALQNAADEAQQASERADEANRAKTKFVHDMSHELSNPLAAILGHVEMLDRDLAAEQAPHHVHAIQQGANHLLALLDETLEVAAIESGGKRPRFESTDVAQLVRDLVEFARPSVPARRVELTAEIAGDLPRSLRLDQTMLRQVLLNLTKNAIAHTEQGLVTVRVRAGSTVRLSVGPTVCFEVVDTGSGIAEEDLERVFEPFAQAGSEQLGGRGLGLAISRRLVAAMGGELRLRSTVGEGTTFWFEIGSYGRATHSRGHVSASVVASDD